MRFFILIFSLVIFSSYSYAQLYLGYSFSSWGYGNYTELADATVSTASGNDGADNITLPFPFNYMGINYMTARISVNGWLEMGQTYSGFGYNNDLASTTTKPFICPLWDDLTDDENSEIRYKTFGAAPARVFVVEWKNLKIGYSRKSFQLKLYEIDGAIEFHYGPQSDQGSYFSASIGLNDHTGGINHFISITPSTFSSADTVTANNSISTFNQIEEGKSFLFIPGGRVFQITTYQITDNVIKGAANQPVIAVLITSRTGVLTMPSVTSISFSTNGSTNTGDILNAKLYTTGTSPYFSTNYQTGNTVNNPSGSFSINGGANLADYATNFLWLTYDVSAEAQTGNLLDAECFEVSFNLTFPRAPEITSPPGSRMIVAGNGLAGTYTIGTEGNFISLTAAVDTLTETFITAPVTLEFLNNYNSSTETFPIVIPFINGSSSNKIIIRPGADADSVKISSNAGSVLTFDNAYNVTIDGRPGGTGSERSLTISNENKNGSAIIVTNNSKKIDLSFCNVLGCDSSETGGVIHYKYGGYYFFGDSISISNCFIGRTPAGKPKNGIFLGSGAVNWNIANCIINDFTGTGIKLGYCYFTLIEGNEIFLTTPSNLTKVTGIACQNAYSTSILRNKIYSLSTDLNTANSISGIEIPLNINHKIINNFISLSGNENSMVTGIDYVGSTSGNEYIYNNTIYIYGNSAATDNSYCFRMRKGDYYYTQLNLRIVNNILINKRTNVQGTGIHYAIGIYDKQGISELNYNDYYASGNGAMLGRWVDINVDDFSIWKYLTQMDTQSISKNVDFISNTDLHLAGSAPGDTLLIAQPYTSVPFDIDNEPRSLYFPYMGADENLEFPLPVELLAFTAEVSGNGIQLSWSTASELNNKGFEIQRQDINKEWTMIAFIPGNGTSTELNTYSFTDPQPLQGENIYRLKQVDYDGKFFFSETKNIIYETENYSYNLFQNYPNPFNPVTSINYQIAEPVKVSLKIYDILGNEIAVLEEGMKEPGSYSVQFDASSLSSGVYFYQLNAGSFYDIKKMIVLK